MDILHILCLRESKDILQQLGMSVAHKTLKLIKAAKTFLSVYKDNYLN